MFTQVQDLIAPMGYKVVDVQKRETPGGVELYLTVFLADRDVTTDDLAEVYLQYRVPALSGDLREKGSHT